MLHSATPTQITFIFINYINFKVNSRHLHQIPSQTWQNMPSLGTERLNPKGVKPFFMPEHN